MNAVLVRKHEPILRFARGENFFPMKVEEYVEECGLYSIDFESQYQLPPKWVDLDVLGNRGYASEDHYLAYAARRVQYEKQAEDLYRQMEDQTRDLRGPELVKAKRKILTEGLKLVFDLLELFPVLRDRKDIFEQALTKYGGLEEHDPTYYYLAIEDGKSGYQVVQYWFFYAYNDCATSHKGGNDHEADWECVHVFFKDDDPKWAAYSFHGEHGPKITRKWHPDHMCIADGHPVVFVGAGSHGNYFRRHTETDIETYREKKPWVDGDRVVGPTGTDPWANAQPLNEPWVLQFKGRWGARRKGTPLEIIDKFVGAPTGPKFDRDGNLRKEWDSPAEYAGLV